jgi:glycosyltransferase involved in cell wall biosynthesis
VAGVSQNPEKTEQESGRFYPKVSIVIPVYNGANYMRDAIDSALAQTYGNLEVVVVNDGSRDGGETDRIARSYGDRIRYFSKENGGVATALNLGIEKMTGEYFSWLSHDDMYKPDKVEHEVRALAKQTDRTVVVAEGYQVVNRDGAFQYNVNLHTQYEAERLQSGLFCLLRGGINGCAMLIHKSQFARVGLFDPALPTTQDYDLWFRMLRGQPIVYLSSTNVLSRSHDEQGSKAMLDVHVQECDALWIGMLDALTEQERRQVSENDYEFYREVWSFLSSVTGYKGAIAYAARGMAQAAAAQFGQIEREDVLETLAQGFGITLDTMRETVLPVLTRPKKEKRIFFQLGERNENGGLNKIVVSTASALSVTYDVMIGSWNTPYSDGYPAVGVTELCFDAPEENVRQYAAMLSALSVDIYIFSYCCAAKFLPLLGAIKAAGIATVAWSHEDYRLPYWREALWASLPRRRIYLPKADAVVWLNSTSQALYGLQNQNGTCIPNQISMEIDLPPCQSRRKRLLAVGRFDDAIKGLGDLLQAFERIQKRHPDAELDIVGSLDLNLPLNGKSGMTCGQFLERSTINQESLHLVSWTDSIAEYYRKSALLLMPSMYEGFGLVVLEAAAHHTPAVAYDGSGMADIITDGADGVLVKRGDWIALADQVATLLDQPEKITEMQHRLPEMLDRYRPENVLGCWKELLDMLLSGDKTARDTYFAAHHASVPDVDTMKSALREYEDALLKMYKAKEMAIIFENDPWKNECQRLQEECQRLQTSSSWRITKPLRMVKGVLRSLRNVGLRLTVQKIITRLKGARA